MSGVTFVETLLQDLRYALRVLRNSPGFTAVAVLSMALGIGANSAVFSVVNAVLLRALPYPHPEQLVRLSNMQGPAATIPEFLFWKEHMPASASTAGYRDPGNPMMILGARQEPILTMKATADLFRTLGVVPSIGREFNTEETTRNGPLGIILTDSLWRRAFNADPNVLGQSVTLDDAHYTVVGVLPANFWFPQSADAFVPLQPTGSLSDNGMNTNVIARLKPGVTFEQAEAEMPAMNDSYRNSKNLSKEYIGLAVTPFQKSIVGDVRTNLLLLFGAVGLLLLIACSNLASLLVARLAARQREIAVRRAMGSTLTRLLCQFLIENLLLVAAGSALGLLAAYWSLNTLIALVPFDLHASGPIRLNFMVLAFTLAIAAGTGILFSLAPFVTSSRLDVYETLKAGGRSGGGGARQRTRGILVIGEVALSVTLLVAAALLIQTLYRLRQERLGFSTQGVITFMTPPTPERRGKGPELRAFEQSVLERIQTMPGVRSVAAISVLPLGGGHSNLPTQREGHPEQSIGGMEVRMITPGYFETLGIPMRRGRPFSKDDAISAVPVMIVNETLARRWWPNDDAVGDRVVIGRFRGRNIMGDIESPRAVVGVVADTKTEFLKDPPMPTVYIPAAQASWMTTGVSWVVRSNLSPGIGDELRKAIAEIDSHQRMTRLRTMEEIVTSTTADSRFDAWLFGIFAGLALLLTSIGVYGLLSFSVARRTNEIGTRMALGATRWDVLGLVLKEGFGLIAIGLAVGLAAAVALSRFLSSLLFGVSSTDLISFIAVAVVLLIVGAAASYLPARRATKVDPMVALRYE